MPSSIPSCQDFNPIDVGIFFCLFALILNFWAECTLQDIPASSTTTSKKVFVSYCQSDGRHPGRRRDMRPGTLAGLPR